MATTSYELPDTKVIDIGVERFKIPEAMFHPTVIEVSFHAQFLNA